MISPFVIAAVAVGYLLILFALAYTVDRQPGHGSRAINSSVVYTLSLAIYCTSWTFYGSVGLASKSGIQFLPIYLGPTLAFCLGWALLRKILRVSKANRITSIASLIASRYGKSSSLGGLVTIIAVIGTVPYLALQLKAVSTSFTALTAKSVPSRQLRWRPDPGRRRPVGGRAADDFRDVVRQPQHPTRRASSRHGRRRGVRTP